MTIKIPYINAANFNKYNRDPLVLSDNFLKTNGTYAKLIESETRFITIPNVEAIPKTAVAEAPIKILSNNLLKEFSNHPPILFNAEGTPIFNMSYTCFFIKGTSISCCFLNNINPYNINKKYPIRLLIAKARHDKDVVKSNKKPNPLVSPVAINAKTPYFDTLFSNLKIF